MSDIMYRVAYYGGGCYSVLFKEFKNSAEAFSFAMQLPTDSVLEIKYYENSDNYRPAFWCEE